MTKQPEDWLDDVPGDDIEDEVMRSSGSVKVKLNVTPKS